MHTLVVFACLTLLSFLLAFASESIFAFIPESYFTRVASTSTMCVHVNSLPDDCLLPVFDRISLTELLKLNGVCPRWAFLLPRACARRRTLVLIGAVELPYDFPIPLNDTFEVTFNVRRPFYDLPVGERDNSLTLPYLAPNDAALGDDGAEVLTELARFREACLSGQLVPYLTELFPRVNKLVVIDEKCCERELSALVDLLRSSWSLKIFKVHLKWKFDERYVDRPDRYPVGTLLEAINQQCSLRQLTLDISCGNESTFPAESFSFIGRLNVLKLYLGQYDRHNIWNTVQRFDHPALREIGLGNDTIEQVEHALNPAFAHLAPKVRQLYTRGVYSSMGVSTVGKFRQFCDRFGALTSVQIHSDLTFAQLVPHLALLTELTHLWLDVPFHRTILSNVNWMVAAEEEEEEQEVAQPISLPRVKVLELVMARRTQHELDSLEPDMFPSVELIILHDYNWSCVGCRYACYIDTNEADMRAMRCHRLLILSLKRKFARSLVGLYSDTMLTNGPDEVGFVDWSNFVRTEEHDVLP